MVCMSCGRHAIPPFPDGLCCVCWNRMHGVGYGSAGPISGFSALPGAAADQAADAGRWWFDRPEAHPLTIVAELLGSVQWEVA